MSDAPARTALASAAKRQTRADLRFRDCRNDERVRLVPSLPEGARMTRDDTIGLGPKGWHGEDPAWMACFNRTAHDGFATGVGRVEVAWCGSPHGRSPSP